MAKVALVKDAPPEAAEAAPASAPKGKRKKLLVMSALAVLLLGGGGAGAWYFNAQNSGSHAAEKPVAELPPVFLPIDQFTVNLNPEGGDQFLQAAFTLKVSDHEVEEAVKQRLPEVRNRILLLLSAKKATELTSVEGKQALAGEILAATNETIAPSLPVAKKAEGKQEAKGKTSDKAKPVAAAPVHAVTGVLITHFIIQ